MKYLGMDLGTANTYLYGVNSLKEIPEAIVVPGVSDASGSMASAVLYENGKPILAGNVAEAEFYSQPGLQPKRRLATQFKPEIGLAVPEALAATADFLRLVAEALPKGVIESDTVLTVGVPALARADFNLNLEECFRKAGWIKPAFARESDAALISCLQSGVLHVNDISRKCLIFDFGGGTCDFTSVENLDILQNGGDLLYGGRLFDDLFFQSFCAANPGFAKSYSDSPFAWYAHWVECRLQKEKFSDFISANPEAKISLRITWHDAAGRSQEAFLHDYGKEDFLRDAENFRPSAELLAILAPYLNRGGLSRWDRDLLAGREVGLISWLKELLEDVRNRRDVARIILTGGSSRWLFVQEIAHKTFPGAKCLASLRGYEDIAFGLALFPLLNASRAAAVRLLEGAVDVFAREASERANGLVARQADRIARLCSERIVNRDVMPALEAAQKQSMTAAELENLFAANIAADSGLLAIVEENSEALRKEIEEQLNYSFRAWLKKNGVQLAPSFDFAGQAIGKEFFDSVSVKISRLDSLNLMQFTLEKVMPVIAATATAGVIAHGGEPVSAMLGGSAAFGATWLLARAAPKMLENRKLPAFILNESNRKKIAKKNQEHIEDVLRKSLADTQSRLAGEIERRLKDSLEAMLASLSALNQVSPQAG